MKTDHMPVGHAARELAKLERLNRQHKPGPRDFPLPNTTGFVPVDPKSAPKR